MQIHLAPALGAPRPHLLAISLSLALALLASACGSGGGPGGPPGQGGDGDKEKEAPPPPVEVVTVTTGPISDGLEATATVQARHRAALRARAGGTLARLDVDEGDAVSSGQVLARIAQPTYESVLRKARATVDKARQDLRAARRLAKQGVLPAQQLEEAEFQLKQARLEVERIEDERAQGRVVSPIDGVIVSRSVEPGEAISPGALLFEVADLSALEADLFVPERHLARLGPGLPVSIQADGIGDGVLRGAVARIAPTVDPRSGTVKVTVDLGDGRVDDARRLRPGMYVRARIVIDTREAAVLVPRRAVVYENDRPFAFRVVDGKASKLSLEIGYADRDQVEIRSPVAAGDVLVVFGQRGLQDGSEVRVVEPPADDAAQSAPQPAGDSP